MDVNNTLSLAGKDLVSILIRENTMITKGNKELIKTELRKKRNKLLLLFADKRSFTNKLQGLTVPLQTQLVTNRKCQTN